jgi:hypothetical protein
MVGICGTLAEGQEGGMVFHDNRCCLEKQLNKRNIDNLKTMKIESICFQF